MEVQPGMSTGVGLGKGQEELCRLLVSRRIITSAQLEEAIRFREAQAGKGHPSPTLGQALVQKGFLPSETVILALRSEAGVGVACEQCAARFKILSYNPSASYTCKRCGGRLKRAEAKEGAAQEATQVIPAALAGPSPAEVAAAAQDPASLFGKYVLIKEMGSGGQAVVYKAWDSYLSRYIVLKFLREQGNEKGPTPGSSGGGVHDFLREARLAACLRHPNIVAVHEVGCLNGRYYISMDLIGGSTLAEGIHGWGGRPLETRFAVEPEKFLILLRTVALAVEHAHRQTPPIVHRDLKPRNILLDAQGRPFVADFGLARQLDPSREDSEEGFLKGTPSYMAPEQVAGQNDRIDARTDVYGLGAILYEMLCGRPPYIGTDVRQVLDQILTTDPDPPTRVIACAQASLPETAHRPQPVPRALEAICLKALKRDPAKRHASAREFAEAIHGYLRSQQEAAQTAQTRRHVLRQVRAHPWRSALIAGAIIAAAVGAAVGTAGRAPEPEPAVELSTRASRHLAAREWAALKTVVEEMARETPPPPRLQEFRAALQAHEASFAKARAEWKAGLDRLGKEALRPCLEELRTRFRGHGELRDEFRDQLRWALAALQPACVEEARRLAESPRDAWREKDVKARAQDLKNRMDTLLGLREDREFRFEADPSLAQWRSRLDSVIGYLGTWELQVNVVPYAEVALFREGREIAREHTPMGLKGLEVAAEGYRVELSWPSRTNSKVRITQEVKGLRHAQRVILWGDMAKSELRMEME